MITTTFVVPRRVTREAGPFSLSVEAVACRVSIAPSGGRHRSSAVVTVTHDSNATDGAVVVEALEVALRSTNRVLHAVSFVGGGRRARRLLELRDLDELVVESDGRRLEVPPDMMVAKDSPLNEPVPGDDAKVQALLSPLGGDLSEAGEHWATALEAFYDDRLREAVVTARAALEVGVAAAFRAAAARFARQPSPDAVKRMIEAFVAEAERSSFPDRLHRHSEVLLGFSFQRDWDPAKWARLNTFFNVRHGVAHKGQLPSPDEVFAGLHLAREVLDVLHERLAAPTTAAP